MLTRKCKCGMDDIEEIKKRLSIKPHEDCEGCCFPFDIQTLLKKLEKLEFCLKELNERLLFINSNKEEQMVYRGCQCEECMALPLGLGHTSDCAVHNEPASPKGECNCGALEILDIRENWAKNWTYHAPVYIEKLLNWIFIEKRQ